MLWSQGPFPSNSIVLLHVVSVYQSLSPGDVSGIKHTQLQTFSNRAWSCVISYYSPLRGSHYHTLDTVNPTMGMMLCSSMPAFEKVYCDTYWHYLLTWDHIGNVHSLQLVNISLTHNLKMPVMLISKYEHDTALWWMYPKKWCLMESFIRDIECIILFDNIKMFWVTHVTDLAVLQKLIQIINIYITSIHIYSHLFMIL